MSRNRESTKVGNTGNYLNEILSSKIDFLDFFREFWKYSHEEHSWRGRRIFSYHKRIVTRPKILYGIFLLRYQEGSNFLHSQWETDLNTTLIPISSSTSTSKRGSEDWWSSKKSCMWNVLLGQKKSFFSLFRGGVVSSYFTIDWGFILGDFLLLNRNTYSDFRFL